MGPIWLTVPIAAPVPEKSVAPNSPSRMLKVNTSSTEYGRVSMSAGSTDTRATNQVCNRYSRQANGGRNITTRVSKDMAMNPPKARTGFVSGFGGPGSTMTTGGMADAIVSVAVVAAPQWGLIPTPPKS